MWEDVYMAEKQNSVWPWSDLISYIMRFSQPNRVLELGCGMGANIPFFKSLGVDYYGIDMSVAAIKRLSKSFPDISLLVDDYTKQILFDGEFDLIVDRGGLSCNTMESMQRCMDLIYNKLTFGGKFIGIDIYSDRNERNLGNLTQLTLQQITNLFKRFKTILLEHKEVIPHPYGDRLASWNIVVEKTFGRQC